MFTDKGFDVASFIFRHSGPGAGFNRAASRFSQNVTHFAEDGAGVHQNVEQNVVFVDLNRAFLKYIETGADIILLDDSCSWVMLFLNVHTLS